MLFSWFNFYILKHICLVFVHIGTVFIAVTYLFLREQLNNDLLLQLFVHHVLNLVQLLLHSFVVFESVLYYGFVVLLLLNSEPSEDSVR